MKKLVLACILIFTLWPPAGGMATRSGMKPKEDIIDRKYTFKETLNYIRMRIDIIADQENMSDYDKRELKREAHFHYFIKKHIYCLDDGKRRFDLDEADLIILRSFVKLREKRQTVFSLDLEL